MEKQVVKYDINAAAIAEMAKIYMELTISDLENEDEFNAVHAARMVVKSHRVRLDKDVKKQNDIANSFKKDVKVKAAPLYDGLKPIETHLWDEENKVLSEQKRIKDEEAAREKEKIERRVVALAEYEVVIPFLELATMTQDKYEKCLVSAVYEYTEKQKRLAEEKRLEEERLEKERLEREAEKKRLADQKAEQDRIQKEQDERDLVAQEKQDRIEAESAAKIAAIELAEAEALEKIDEANRKIEADRKALEADKKAEQEKKDRERFEMQAKLRAEEEAKERFEREEQDRLDREADEKKEAKRVAALKPDKQKMIEYAETLMSTVEPSVASQEAQEFMVNATNRLSRWFDWFKSECDKL